MADKGFTIHDELKDLGLSLIIPSFAVADKRMSQANLVLTDKIASHSCRTTDLSDKRFQDPESQDCCSPFSPSGKLNQVWCVCCYLTLCQGYVLKKTRYVCTVPAQQVCLTIMVILSGFLYRRYGEDYLIRYSWSSLNFSKMGHHHWCICCQYVLQGSPFQSF